ncbi:methylenetetrahydrofolate reductase (NADPH) [Maniola hyperantus]|uniref:methylenetetrahydrofolate reductase (NADPH) n=1 Tax=Aphantopus hyperantus TaxID=2795564 RepID=UPI00156A6FD9|nr:methylenetetrahydrofolate reductase [Maniola hyperantus]
MPGRITEIINKEGNMFSYSFEVTPDILPDIKDFELENLDLEPEFFSVTWHAQVHECTSFEIAPLKLAKYLRYKGKIVLLHISCCNMRKNYLDDLLVLLKDIGICNLFIILGEKFDSFNSDFGSSQDMIIHIRRSTGNYFCICVAGFPEREGNILQLKEKVKCGVDFILIQAFFEFKAFQKFVMDCKEADINVPIIPGIFPFETENELQGFMKLCRVHDQENIVIKKLSNLSGTEIVTELVNEITQQLQIKHLHFFTLNKMQRTTNLIRNIGNKRNIN